MGIGAFQVFGTDSPLGVVAGIFTALFFGVFVLVGVAVFSAGLFLLCNSLRVVIEPGRIVSTRRTLGLPFTRSLSLADIDHMEVEIDGQVGQGADAKVSYALRAISPEGRRLPLGDGIQGSAVAETLADLLAESTGREIRHVERNRPRPSRRPHARSA